jgi:hypothetical protein
LAQVVEPDPRRRGAHAQRPERAQHERRVQRPTSLGREHDVVIDPFGSRGKAVLELDRATSRAGRCFAPAARSMATAMAINS